MVVISVGCSLSLELVRVGVEGAVGASVGVVPLPRLPRPGEEDGELWLPFVAGLLVCPLLVTGLGAGGVDWTHLFFDGGGVKGGGDLAACLSLIFLQLCTLK